jgi:hypothetical protein
MALGLPETSSQISKGSSPSSDVELVERSKNVYRSNFSSRFGEGLDGGVEVFSDSVGAGVPKANAFSKFEAEGVVRERKGSVPKAEEIAELYHAVGDIVGASDGGNFHMVADKHLAWLKYRFKHVFPLEMFVDFLNVLCRHQGICVDDGEDNCFGVNLLLYKENLLQMLSTPADVRSFSSLFMFPQCMHSVIK